MHKVLLFLGEMEDSDIDWFIAFGRKLTLAKGEVLISEGESTESLYILVQGQLSVTLKEHPDVAIARLKAGEVVGELSFLDNKPPSANVIGHTDCLVIAIPLHQLELKAAGEPEFAARFYRGIGIMLASRLRKADRRLTKVVDDSWSYSESQDDEEIDLDELDAMSIAGARFDFIIRRLSGA